MYNARTRFFANELAVVRRPVAVAVHGNGSVIEISLVVASLARRWVCVRACTTLAGDRQGCLVGSACPNLPAMPVQPLQIGNDISVDTDRTRSLRASLVGDLCITSKRAGVCHLSLLVWFTLVLIPPPFQDLAGQRIKFYGDTVLYGSYNPYRPLENDREWGHVP